MDSRPSMLKRRRLLTAAGGTVAASVAGCLGDTSDDADTDNSDTTSNDGSARNDRATVIAHRGFADTYPENTVEAFELAVEGEPDDGADRRGADWIELDVFPTSDGEVVVFHDDRLEDLTDTSGTIYELPAEDVLSAEVLQSGATIPTLADALDAIPKEVGVNIDIKRGEAIPSGRVADPGEQREAWEWLDTVVEIATEQDNEILYSSFWEGALYALDEIDPDLSTAYIFSASISDGLDVTDEYEADAISAPMRMIDRAPFFDPSHQLIDLVAEAHERDLPIHVWTVNTWYEVEQLIDAGVDGLFLDYAEIVRWGGLQ